MTPGKLVRVKNGTVEVFRSTMRLVVDKGIGEIEEVADQDADSFSVKASVPRGQSAAPRGVFEWANRLASTAVALKTASRNPRAGGFQHQPHRV